MTDTYQDPNAGGSTWTPPMNDTSAALNMQQDPNATDSMETAGGALPSPGVAVQGAPQPDMNALGAPAIPQQGQVQAPQDMQQEMNGTSPQQGQIQVPPKMVSFVRGEGAATPQQVMAAQQQVDPTGQMDPNDLHLATIHAAAQTNPDEAFAIMQAYRQKYDMTKAIAAVAADGTPNKAPDLTASTQAANTAMDHIPDGNKVVFSPSMQRAPDGMEGSMPQGGRAGYDAGLRRGVTATVTAPNGKVQTIPMSGQQYRDFLTGPQGSFDYLMNKPVQQALKATTPTRGTAPNTYPADSGGGQVQIHAVGPGGGGTDPSGVRIGSELGHLKPLNYEPIPPAGQTSGKWGTGRPSGSGEIDPDQNAPGAGVPADLQPDRVINPTTGTVQRGDGGLYTYGDPTRGIMQKPPGGPGSLPEPAPQGAQGTQAGVQGGRSDNDQGGNIRVVRGGAGATTYDANGNPIPQYNTQQQHEQEIQKLKNIPLTQKNNNYQQNILSKEGIAAARNASNERIQYAKSHTADQNNRRTNLVNALRTSISATGDPEGEIDKFKPEMAKLGVNPQDILQEAKLPGNYEDQIKQADAPATTQSETGDMVNYKGKQYPDTKMFYGLPYKFNPKTGSYEKPQ